MKITDDRKLDSDRAWVALVGYGDDWADKDSAANLLEETKKSVLAEIKAKSEGKSDAAKEMAALADPAYREHLGAMVAARRDSNKARVRYDSARVLAELRRSEESTRRAELTMR